MVGMFHLRDIKKKYEDQVDFVLVYISEAHPANTGHVQWSSKKDSDIYALEDHTRLEDRIDAAEILQETAGENWKILIDDMDNQACHDYGAHPERIFVIRNGLVDFVGTVVVENGFDTVAFEKHLKKIL